MVTACLVLAGIIAARTIRPFRRNRRTEREIAEWDAFAAALRTAES